MTETQSDVVETTEDVVVEAPGQETDPVASLTADLQRIYAEYANYRKNEKRLRAAAIDESVGAVLREFLGVLDDLDRAESHGELTGGFKAVADQIQGVANRIGLEKFGEAGSEFDPTIHEALMHDTSADVAVPTATKILQPGYKYKERVLRPARVAVTEPAPADTSDIEAGE